MKDKLPIYFESTYAMIRSAYPKGIAHEDREGVMLALSDDMSLRSVAEFFTYFENSDYIKNYNDVLGVCVLKDGKHQDDFNRVLRHLREFGYDEWLKEE